MTEQRPFAPARYALVLVIALAVIVLDQATKVAVAHTLAGRAPVALAGGLIYLDYTRNTGAAFSLLQAHGSLFVVVAVVVSLAIVLSYRRIAGTSTLTRIALGLVLGGALGNLIDRVRLGYVVDFIDLRWWPVFNLADSAIVIGVILLVLATMGENA